MNLIVHCHPDNEEKVVKLFEDSSQLFINEGINLIKVETSPYLPKFNKEGYECFFCSEEINLQEQLKKWSEEPFIEETNNASN